MKTRILILLCAIMFLLPATSYSQFGGVMRRAVNRQINKEVDSLLDKKVQDEQNKNRAKQKAEQQQKEQAVQQDNSNAQNNQDQSANVNSDADASAGANPGANFGALLANKVTLKYKENYDFTSRLYMVSEVFDKKETMKMDMYMFYSSASPVIGIETNTIKTEEEGSVAAKMIMDGENKVFLILSDANGMKMGMISEIPDENTNYVGPDGKPIKNYTPPTFVKTGNSREILGYKCDEYTYNDKELKTSGKVWFTKEAKINIDQRGWNNSNMSYYYGSQNFKDGIILANESYDKNGELATRSETKEINENFPHSISVTGYPLRQLKNK